MPNPATQIAPGDITAPATPGAPSVVPYGRGLQITVSYSPPTDFFRYRYFKNGVLWRETPANSQIDYDVNYSTTYQYTVAAMDTALPANVSAQSGIGSGVPVPIGGTDISGNSISSAHIQAGAVGSASIAANSITSAHIQAGAVQNINIAANAVQTANILAGNITTLTIAAGNITNLTIQDGAVSTSKVAANAITAGGQVTSTTRINFGVGSPGPAPVDMPGMVLSMTTVGGVCQIMVSVVLYVQNFGAALTNVGGVVLVQRDGVTVSPTFFTSFTATPLGQVGDWNYMTVSFSFLDLPSAGAHTWKILWGVGMGTMAMDALNRYLTIIEFRR